MFVALGPRDRRSVLPLSARHLKGMHDFRIACAEVTAVRAGSERAPSLLCGLAGNAEPGADLGPGVAADAQALDRLGHRGVDLLGQAVQEDEGLDGGGLQPV